MFVKNVNESADPERDDWTPLVSVASSLKLMEQGTSSRGELVVGQLPEPQRAGPLLLKGWDTEHHGLQFFGSFE
jgi:hypothetical protein